MTSVPTLIIPAYNEEKGLKVLFGELSELTLKLHVLVINDGSTDNTSEVASSFGVEVISHPYRMGNGAAIKTGTRHASSEILIFMDGDGQHQVKDIPLLLASIDEGYDMVVGARNKNSHASLHRRFANAFYNRLASVITGHKIVDLTSGFRAVRADKFREFIDLLPNGFSYPTTSTMAFFRAGYSVNYQPIDVKKRIGKSNINLIRDGLRFLLIIFKIGTLYSPLKIYFPISFLTFMLGLSYYGYTYFTDGRFTNMGVLLFLTSLILFFMGLLSEQITILMYKSNKNN